MIELQDYDIQLIEREIYLKYELTPCDYADSDCLLSLRKTMINERALAHQEEILPDIIAFNDALRKALREMYDRAHRIWNSIKDRAENPDHMHLSARCYLGNDYPPLHPVQGDDRQELWNALCDCGWNRIYEDGVTHGHLIIPMDEEYSFERLTGMDCTPPNWNEGLDQELTKDLHLILPFHHLFDHMRFAITDFIYVRQFETEINIEIRK